MTEKEIPKLAGVYKFTNKKNGKVYIGKALNLRRRYSAHKHNAKKENPSSYFYKSVKKHGLQNFYYSLIEVFPTTAREFNPFLLERESFWIKIYDAANDAKGYNACEYSNDLTGCKFSEETCKKMSESRKGEKNPCFGKFGASHPAYGYVKTEEHRKTISEALKGKPKNRESVEKSAAKIRRPILQKDKFKNVLRRFSCAREAVEFLFGDAKIAKNSACNIFRGIRLGRESFGYFWEFETPKATDNIKNIPPKDVRKPVVQLDPLTNDQIKVWPSIKEAAKGVGVSPTAIAQCLRGETHKSGGFKWIFAKIS